MSRVLPRNSTPASPGPQPRRPFRRGSVLIIVLVTLLFASAALVAFIEKAGDNLTVDAREAIAHRLRQEAYSALEVTLAVLEDFRLTNGALHSPAEGWSDPLGFAGWSPREGCTAEVSFADESGKISLPNVQPATLLSLLESWGLAQHDAEQVRDALMGWMRRDYVPTTASLSDYEHAAIPYDPPLRSLRTYDELAAIDYTRTLFYDENHQPNDLWRKFVATFSLFDFKQTNMNGASSELVGNLDWLDKSQQRQLGDYLNGTGTRAQEGHGYFQNANQAANILGVQSLPPGYGTEIKALRVNVVIHQGGTSFRLSAVVAPSGGATVVLPVAPETSSSKVGAGGNSQTASTTSQTAAAAPKKLNYPFTLLEIEENAVISTVPVETPKA